MRIRALCIRCGYVKFFRDPKDGVYRCQDCHRKVFL